MIAGNHLHRDDDVSGLLEGFPKIRAVLDPGRLVGRCSARPFLSADSARRN
jgi:hypothetical protein